jgi:hypothetical protein
MTPPTIARATALLGLLGTLACGSSNSERPYVDAAPPSSGTGGSTPAGSSTGGSPGNGSGGAPGTIDPGRPLPDPSDAMMTPGSGGSAGSDAGGGPGPSDVGAPEAPPASPACAPVIVPACDAPPPPAPAKRPWHAFGSGLVAGGGSPRHRGRDLLFTPDGPQWLIAHIAYGLFEGTVPGEEVDVFLLRNCGGSWESLGTSIITRDGEHAAVDGVDDGGGRVFLSLPADKRLGPGRHRVRFIVAGDGSATESFVEVRPTGTPIAVVDVDGTLTTSDAAEFGSLLIGQLPGAQPDAARALHLLPDAGYRILYLSARPEWLTQRTREFLQEAGFPAGIVETTTGGSGAVGADATKFKSAALARIAGKGLHLALAIGNTDSDASAYAAGGVEPAQRRIFLRFTDDEHGGRRIEKFADLLPDFTALAAGCRP